MTIGLLHPNPSPTTGRPVLLGCPDCGRAELLLRVETPVPVTVTHTGTDPFDPDGYTVARVDHSPTGRLEPWPIGVQCTHCGWTNLAPNWTDHLTPAGL